MIIYSDGRDFPIRKYVSGYRGHVEIFNNVTFSRINNFNYFRVKSRDTKLLVRSIWPVFTGAPGLQPFGSTVISFDDYFRSYYINDWNRPLVINEVFPILPNAIYDDSLPMILKLSEIRLIYDSLNIKDIYDGESARVSIYIDIEVAE